MSAIGERRLMSAIGWVMSAIVEGLRQGNGSEHTSHRNISNSGKSADMSKYACVNTEVDIVDDL